MVPQGKSGQHVSYVHHQCDANGDVVDRGEVPKRVEGSHISPASHVTKAASAPAPQESPQPERRRSLVCRRTATSDLSKAHAIARTDATVGTLGTLQRNAPTLQPRASAAALLSVEPLFTPRRRSSITVFGRRHQRVWQLPAPQILSHLASRFVPSRGVPSRRAGGASGRCGASSLRATSLIQRETVSNRPNGGSASR